MQAFVDIRYEYHWTPLIGCLTALLRTVPSHVIGAVTGLSYRPPDEPALPSTLASGLNALGAHAHVIDRPSPNRIDRFRARRRIRSELADGRAVAAFGVGESAFGPTWGLIVGLDDERSSWRRDGPMTDQVSPWLPEASLWCRRLALITVSSGVSSDPADWTPAAADAWRDSLDAARDCLQLLIDQLDSSVELEPQRFAYDIQALAANWGEAAAFWRERRHDRISPAAQQVAVTLSRCATLFPYPMGGQPNHPGVRTTAAGILRDAVTVLDTPSGGH